MSRWLLPLPRPRRNPAALEHRKWGLSAFRVVSVFELLDLGLGTVQGLALTVALNPKGF